MIAMVVGQQIWDLAWPLLQILQVNAVLLLGHLVEGIDAGASAAWAAEAEVVAVPGIVAELKMDFLPVNQPQMALQTPHSLILVAQVHALAVVTVVVEEEAVAVGLLAAVDIQVMTRTVVQVEVEVEPQDIDLRI